MHPPIIDLLFNFNCLVLTPCPVYQINLSSPATCCACIHPKKGYNLALLNIHTCTHTDTHLHIGRKHFPPAPVQGTGRSQMDATIKNTTTAFNTTTHGPLHPSLNE